MTDDKASANLRCRAPQLDRHDYLVNVHFYHRCARLGDDHGLVTVRL